MNYVRCFNLSTINILAILSTKGVSVMIQVDTGV